MTAEVTMATEQNLMQKLLVALSSNVEYVNTSLILETSTLPYYTFCLTYVYDTNSTSLCDTTPQSVLCPAL